MGVFIKFIKIECPASLRCGKSGQNPAFRVTFTADGEIPFPQIVLHGQGQQKLVNGKAIRLASKADGEWNYVASVPAGLLSGGEIAIQVEGCRTADLDAAGGADWIKEFRHLRLEAPPKPKQEVRVASVGGAEVKVYFGIHKHMHQPYYNTTDRNYWDGEKDGIFGSRVGNYTGFIPAAVRQYVPGFPPVGAAP
jgi:hypothetical protein